MEKTSPRFRRPIAQEQAILDGLSVRLIEPEEQARFDALVVEHHYLRSSAVGGEPLRYVATYREEWLGLATWSAGARHLKARDKWNGWSDEQRRRRLPLVANNARLLILPECHAPNLISRFMKLMAAP